MSDQNPKTIWWFTDARHIGTVALLASSVLLMSCSRSENAPADGSGELTQGGITERWNWSDEYETMKSVTELNDDEAAQLLDEFESFGREVDQWWESKGQGLIELEAEIKDAADAGDVAGVKVLVDRAAPVRREITQLMEKGKDNIVATLKPEQQTKWKAHLVAESFLNWADELELTDDQIAKVREASVTAVEESEGEPNQHAAAYMRLEEIVEATMLFADQPRKLRRIKRHNPLRSFRE